MKQEELVKRLQGAFPAMITPMTASGDVDHAGLTHNLQWMNSIPLAGYVLLGSTGEQVHLSEFERALVLELGRRHIGHDRLLIAGTGQPSTRLTIEESKRAAEAGADVALVVTPSYYQKAMTASALIEHYQAVADGSPIPILLYSVPPVTGITIPAPVVKALAAHPNVVGMKNSGSDPKLAGAYREAAANQTFVILSGSAYAAPGFLLMGLADGVILAAGNVVPETAAALVPDAKAQDIIAVRHHAQRLRHASEQIGCFGIAGWKAGVAARGHHGGPARPPLHNLSSEEKENVAKVIQTLFA